MGRVYVCGVFTGAVGVGVITAGIMVCIGIVVGAIVAVAAGVAVAVVVGVAVAVMDTSFTVIG